MRTLLCALLLCACARDLSVPVETDKRPPSLSRFSVSPAYAKAGATLTLTFEGDEDLSTASASFAGAAATCAVRGTSASCTVTAASSMGEGAHAFDAQAADLAHNVTEAPAAASVTLDFTAPVLSLSESPTPALKGSPTSFVVDANEPLGAPPVINAEYLKDPALCAGPVPGTRFICTGASIADTATVGTATFGASGVDRAGNSGSANGTVTIQNPVLPPPHVSVTATPAAARIGSHVFITVTGNQPLTGCIASVAGQVADCGAPTGTSCSCEFVVPSSLGEGNNIVLGFGTNDNGTGTGSSGVQIDNTRPVLDTTHVTLVRNPIGQNDAASAEAGAAADSGGVPYAQRAVTKIALWASQAATNPLVVLTPRPDGSFAEVALPGTDGTSDAKLAPRDLWISALDVAGNESDRLSVQSGFDGLPAADGVLSAFVRRPVGQLDGVAGPAGALQPSTCALRLIRAYDSDFDDEATLLAEGPAAADGSFAELSLGTTAEAPATVYLAPVDKCGSEGAKTQVLTGAGVKPVAAAGAITIVRRDLTALDGVLGDAGALQANGCAVAGVNVYDKISGTLLATSGNVLADGSFAEIPFGTLTRSSPVLAVRAVDKCLIESSDAVPLNGQDPGPAVDGSLATLHTARLGGAGSGVSAAAGTVQSSVSVLVSLQLLDAARAPLGAPFLPGADGGFAQQAIGDRSLTRVLLAATDKAGAITVATVRNVSATLDLTGRVRYQPQPNPVSMYAVSSRLDPRAAGPGLAPLLGPEASGADEALAANSDGSAASFSAADAAAPTAGWKQLATPNGRQTAMLAWDPLRAQLVLFGGDDGTDLDETWVYDAAGWKKLSPAHAPSPRHGSCLFWDGAQLVLFGGRTGTLSSGTLQGDTWSWNGTDWTRLTPQHAPSPRERAGCTGTATGGLLFGGLSTLGREQDTHLWTGSDWTPLTLVARPSPRFAHGVAWNGSKVVLFGGDVSGASGETWLFDPSNNTWSPLSTVTAPIARSGLGLAYDTVRQAVVMYGGTPSTAPLTWELSGSPLNWHAVVNPDAGPRARFGFAWHGGLQRVVMHAGFDLSAGPLSYRSDLQAWNGAAWTALADAPGTRLQHSAVYDSARDRMVVYGGEQDFSSGGNLDELWEFDGASWQRKIPVTKIGGLQRGAFAFDPFRGKAVFFGGAQRDGSHYQETAEWDGSTWKLLTGTTPPGARSDAAMVFDTARGKLVLFGGSSSDAFLGDTWEFDGVRWTQVSAASPPPPRGYPAAAFDPIRNRAVLYGGFLNAAWSGESFEYDGLGWSALATGPAVPTPQLAFDLQSVLLAAPAAQLTAEYDGAWTSLGFATPPPRTDFSIAYDSLRKRALLFGGIAPAPGTTDTPKFSDLWSFTGSASDPAQWGAHYFSFPLDAQALPTKLSVTWQGTGDAYVWNWAQSSWHPLSAGTTVLDATAADYSRGRIWLLAAAHTASSAPAVSTVQTDYASVQLEAQLPP